MDDRAPCMHIIIIIIKIPVRNDNTIRHNDNHYNNNNDDDNNNSNNNNYYYESKDNAAYRKLCWE